MNRAEGSFPPRGAATSLATSCATSPRLVPLPEVTAVIRSKNSGPFELTLDVIFKNEEEYRHLKGLDYFTAELVAGLYRILASDVVKIVYFDPANAVKVTIRRPVASGAIGDADIYGAQQHAPLLGLLVPMPGIDDSTEGTDGAKA